MALGGSASDVLRLVLRQSFGMVLVGAGLGIAAAMAASRILERLVEGMQPAGLSIPVCTLLVLMASALFASYLPARRASRIDPMEALRQE